MSPSTSNSTEFIDLESLPRQSDPTSIPYPISSESNSRNNTNLNTNTTTPSRPSTLSVTTDFDNEEPVNTSELDPLDSYAAASPTGQVFSQHAHGHGNHQSTGPSTGRFGRQTSSTASPINWRKPRFPRTMRVLDKLWIPPQIRLFLSRPIVLVSLLLLSIFGFGYTMMGYSPPLARGSGNEGSGLSKLLPISILPDDGDDGRQILPAIYRPHISSLVFPTSPSSLNQPETILALETKLLSFLLRPIQSYSEALSENILKCPLKLADQLVNPDQLNGEIGFWRDEVDKEMIAQKRAQLVKYLHDVAGSGQRVVGNPDMPGGRGIVLTGGNHVGHQTFLSLLDGYYFHLAKVAIATW